MKVTIIDYGSGNLHSTAKAFEKVASSQSQKVIVSAKIADVKDASYIVLPGVGAFADCMNGLASIDGMIETLEAKVLEEKTPFLGICVGMQLLADKGFENAETDGFGWIKGNVKAVEPNDESLKIPHMGWNNLVIKNSHPFFDGIKDGDHAYFVHSYHMECADDQDILATAEYGGDVTAAIAKDNIMGTQFHPEKSQNVGLKLIGNFLKS